MVNTKISPKKALVVVEPANEAQRFIIQKQLEVQKQSENFLHFIFGETAPCVTPQTFCNNALGPYSDQGPPHFSSVLFRHDTKATPNNPCCMRGPDQLCHYHLLVYTRYTRRDTAVIRAAAHQLKKGPWLCSPIGNTRITRNIANKINIVKESNFYQIPVASPLTEYAALQMCETTSMLVRVGEDFTILDEIIKLTNMCSNIFDEDTSASKIIDNWSTVEPIWVRNDVALDALPWYLY